MFESSLNTDPMPKGYFLNEKVKAQDMLLEGDQNWKVSESDSMDLEERVSGKDSNFNMNCSFCDFGGKDNKFNVSRSNYDLPLFGDNRESRVTGVTFTFVAMAILIAVVMANVTFSVSCCPHSNSTSICSSMESSYHHSNDTSIYNSASTLMSATCAVTTIIYTFAKSFLSIMDGYSWVFRASKPWSMSQQKHKTPSRSSSGLIQTSLYVVLVASRIPIGGTVEYNASSDTQALKLGICTRDQEPVKLEQCFGLSPPPPENFFCSAAKNVFINFPIVEVSSLLPVLFIHSTTVDGCPASNPSKPHLDTMLAWMTAYVLYVSFTPAGLFGFFAGFLLCFHSISSEVRLFRRNLRTLLRQLRATSRRLTRATQRAKVQLWHILGRALECAKEDLKLGTDQAKEAFNRIYRPLWVSVKQWVLRCVYFSSNILKQPLFYMISLCSRLLSCVKVLVSQDVQDTSQSPVLESVVSSSEEALTKEAQADGASPGDVSSLQLSDPEGVSPKKTDPLQSSNSEGVLPDVSQSSSSEGALSKEAHAPPENADSFERVLLEVTDSLQSSNSEEALGSDSASLEKNSSQSPCPNGASPPHTPSSDGVLVEDVNSTPTVSSEGASFQEDPSQTTSSNEALPDNPPSSDKVFSEDATPVLTASSKDVSVHGDPPQINSDGVLPEDVNPTPNVSSEDASFQEDPPRTPSPNGASPCQTGGELSVDINLLQVQPSGASLKGVNALRTPFLQRMSPDEVEPPQTSSVVATLPKVTRQTISDNMPQEGISLQTPSVAISETPRVANHWPPRAVTATYSWDDCFFSISPERDAVSVLGDVMATYESQGHNDLFLDPKISAPNPDMLYQYITPEYSTEARRRVYQPTFGNSSIPWFPYVQTGRSTCQLCIDIQQRSLVSGTQFYGRATLVEECHIYF